MPTVSDLDFRPPSWRRHGEATFVVLDGERLTAMVHCPRCSNLHYAYITDRYVVDANTGYRAISGQRFVMGQADCLQRECVHCGHTWEQYEQL